MNTDNRTNEPTPERWRKKPVEIEAMRYDGENWVEIAQWLRVHDVRIGQTGTRKASIPTLEGTMYASPGDWIIKGVQGEFYPCKPDIFEQTYERAALVAAQGAAPQAESEYEHLLKARALHQTNAGLPSSGVDEDALANLIHSTSVAHFGGLDPRVAPIIARAVAEFLKPCCG